MSLIEALNEKSLTCPQNEKILHIAQDIVRDVIEHSRLISSQMTTYDIHDERHSECLISIIEQLLGDKINSLNFYELLMIYLSSYLHDSGMALPNWEYEALKAVEGNESFYDTSIKYPIRNDFKAVQTIEEIKAYLQTSRLCDYEKAKKFIFVEKTEEELLNHIANLIKEYEIFRNRYVTQLKSKKNCPEYLEYSKIIRSEFIRYNHPKKAASNIHNLRSKIENGLQSFYTNILIEDLSLICQSHGEDFNFIKQQKTERLDWENKKNNIQFISSLLRLADIIHFSSDRAPMSLYAEKQITNEDSLIHWKAKFQDTKYSISILETQIYISFQAYCTEPETYYFLYDYIKYIDAEIHNYFELKREWERLENFNNYNLNFHPNVITENIKYDVEKFIPDTKLKFTLNQAKILDLLMGVQLYKDKYACLREVYQNALDTSKCLIAYNKKHGITESISIEFGIGEEVLEGVTKKFIYCLDHGLGMNKYIIENYLLHIGNSYYKSKDFDEKNTEWNFGVKPTSQFGIGILSCYMIADKIGITTIYYDDKETLSFVLSGISERFYYKAALPSDLEKIGQHGTLLKLYLKEDISQHINSEFIQKMPLYLSDVHEGEVLCTDNKRTQFIKENLFYILFDYLGLCNSEIPVFIKCSDKKQHPIYQYNQLLETSDVTGITKDDIGKLLKPIRFYDGIKPYEEYLENIDYIQNYVVETKTKNVQIHSFISLPKKGIKNLDIHILRYVDFLGNKKGSVCIDGISVNQSSTNLAECLNIDSRLLVYSIVNFVGENRPILSIDRTTCVSYPSLDKNELIELQEQCYKNIITTIENHLQKENIKCNQNEFYFIYDYICDKYINIAQNVLFDLVSKLEEPISFPDETLKDNTINDFLKNEEITIKHANILELRELSRQILISKCISPISIKVIDDDLIIQSKTIEQISTKTPFLTGDELSISSCVIKADLWEGKYSEYDFVSSMWPIINSKLFEKLNYPNIIISEHCKQIDSSGNSIQMIAKMDPTLINPSYGIGEHESHAFSYKKNFLGRPEKIAKNFWLFELNNHGELEYNEKRSPTLFVYIAPRILTEDEKEELETYKQTDPIYYKGVQEGWSIYFLGRIKEYVIVPGIISREEIEKKIPPEYKKLAEDIEYIDTNGKIVF